MKQSIMDELLQQELLAAVAQEKIFNTNRDVVLKILKNSVEFNEEQCRHNGIVRKAITEHHAAEVEHWRRMEEIADKQNL